MESMNVEHMSLEQLKALAWDCANNRDTEQRNVDFLIQKINEKSQPKEEDGPQETKVLTEPATNPTEA